MKKAAVLPILFVVVPLAVAVIAAAQQPKKVLRVGLLAGGRGFGSAGWVSLASRLRRDRRNIDHPNESIAENTAGIFFWSSFSISASAARCRNRF